MENHNDFAAFFADLTDTPAPAETAPVEAAPVEAAPVEAAPVETAPVEAAPVEAAPVETAPVETAPAEAAPVEAAPVETAPVEAAPVEAAPVETAPVEAAPAETAPVEAAPVETAPAETAPVEAAPVEAAPVEAAPVEAAPAETAPVEAAPAETAPVEAAPAETAPAETAPVEAAPVEAAPVEAAPAEAAPVVTIPAAASVEKPGKKKALWLIPVLAVVVLLLAAAGIFGLSILNAQKMYSSGDYAGAKEIYQKLSFIPDFEESVKACDYSMAARLYENGEFIDAREAFLALGDYADSAELADDALYLHACNLKNQKKYEEEALEIFKLLGDYKDSAELFDECLLDTAVELYRGGSYEECLNLCEPYIETSQDAHVYYALSAFRGWDAIGCDYDTRKQLYDMLIDYQYAYADTREALDHPFFFLLRFVDTVWVTPDMEHFFEYIYGDTFNYAVPFGDIPENHGLSYINYDDGLYFNTVDEDGNETLWFKITGFSNYNALHPNNMYIEDSQGNTYHFDNALRYDDVYGSVFYVPDEEA